MKVQMIRVAKFVSFSLLPCMDLSGEFSLQFVSGMQKRPSAVQVANDFLGRRIQSIANFSIFFYQLIYVTSARSLPVENYIFAPNIFFIVAN